MNDTLPVIFATSQGTAAGHSGSLALEWRSAIADIIVETHDRIVGKTVKQSLAAMPVWLMRNLRCDTLQGFSTLGSALLEAHGDEVPLENAVQISVGWPSLESMAATATQLTTKLAAGPLAHVVHGYHRFRRYGPRMLRALDIRAAAVAEPLLDAAQIIGGKDKTVARPLTFLRRGSKWYRHLNAAGDDGLRRGCCLVPSARGIPFW